MLRMILTINSDYFPKTLISIPSTKDALLSLRGRKLIFIYHVEEFQWANRLYIWRHKYKPQQGRKLYVVGFASTTTLKITILSAS
jgi:hypothetical protein